ncbi:MAG: MFS transporter [Acidobacteria bacterium]|nr:MFS transporter [Acidobacteriota bacterium]
MPLPKQDTKNYTPAIIAACLLLLTALTDSHVVPAIAPQIALGLNTSKTFIAFSVSAYAVAAATIAIALAKYSSKINIPKGIVIAVGIFTLAAIIVLIAPNPAIFFIGRTLGGFAGGLISALTIAGIANTTDYGARGKQMSGVAVCYLLAPVLGVPLGTFISGLFSWRILFLITLSSALIAGLLSYFYPLPSVATKKPGEESLENQDNKVQTSSSWGVLWQLAMRSSSTRRGILGAFFVSGGLVGFVTYLGIWLSDAFYLQTNQIGLTYALIGGTAVIGGALGGIFSDRVGKQKIIVQASKFMALFLLILPTFNWSISLFIIMGIVSILAALRIAPLQALVTEIVEPNERPSYIALRNTASQIGIALAVAISGQIYVSYGMAGVCLISCLLTIGAWYSIQGIADFEGKQVFIKRSLQKQIVRAVVSLVLIIVIALPWLLSFFVTKTLTRPDERIRKDTPLEQGVDYKDVEFQSIDGNKLLGWYLPARTEKITFVMTHGMFRSRYEMLDRSIDLWKKGYGVLLYDLRRHGKSVAEFSTLGFYEHNDVIAAVKFAYKQAPENKIVLMGVSMGAAATLLASKELANSPDYSKEIIAVVAESSFLSLKDTIYHHCKRAKIPQIPFALVLTNLIAWRMNFFVNDFDLLNTVKKIPYPILFIGGTNDSRMPNETVLEPLYQVSSNDKKSKYIVKGATHGRAYETEQEIYIKTLVDFLKKIENPVE